LIEQKLREAKDRIKSLQAELKKSQRVSKEITSKDKVIKMLQFFEPMKSFIFLTFLAD